MKKFLLLLAIGCGSVTLGDSALADALTAQVDALFAPWDNSSTPGCSIAVFQDGDIVYQRGYGMADLDHGIANTPSTVFHVASVSKQFAAAAVVLLAQDGELALDDPARKYLPELPDFGTPITIRQLVHHTSGLRDQWGLLSLSGWRDSQDLVTDDDVMTLVGRQKALNFTPGAKHSYSNTGYTLLAQIVQRVSGRSFREFTTERIFRPLGMRATHFRDDFTEIVPNIAYGYASSGDTFKVSVTNFNTVGATSLLTTVEDLARWDQSLYDGKVGGKALLQQMVERGVLNDGTRIDYAFGLSVGTYRGLQTVSHSGSDAGYRAYLVRFPQQRFGIACLCNAGDASPTTISQKVADLYLAGELQPPPPLEPAVMVPESQLSGLSGTYVSRDGRDVRRISLRDGKLRMGYDDAYSSGLEPVGNSRFRMEEDYYGIEFSDHPLRVTLVPKKGEPQVFEHVPAYAPAAQRLAQYAGTYVSEQIELPYRIAVNGEALVVRSMKNVKGLALKPLAPDFFSGTDFGTVRFTRDRHGRVSGFLINSGRIVDLRFSRR